LCQGYIKFCIPPLGGGYQSGKENQVEKKGREGEKGRKKGSDLGKKSCL